MRFSERHGFVVPRTAIQTDSLDAATRNRLINLVIQDYLHNMSPLLLSSAGAVYYKLLICEFFKAPINQATDRYDHAAKSLVEWSQKCEWHKIFDLMEFVAASDDAEGRKYFIRQCNNILEAEKIGFRFVKGQITSIVDKIEVAEIENVFTAGDPFAGAKSHIARALELYSDRKNPDYRNSIKEAISAVESTCKVISKKDKATLSDALKAIETKHSLHPALKDALKKLYGYSSDKQGIRHALVDDPNVGHAEAKFMLVGCSAFCNYLVEQCKDS